MNQNERIELYKQVFLNDPLGQKVLEDLCGRYYDRNPYKAGGLEAERSTLINLGERGVVQYILTLTSQIIQPLGESNE